MASRLSTFHDSFVNIRSRGVKISREFPIIKTKANHMNPDTAKTEVFTAITALLEDKSIVVTEDLPLIGSDSVLDSMKLVELCLALEDKAADLGFEFDWTSDAAMSKSRSMFRTAGALAAEFLGQMESKK